MNLEWNFLHQFSFVTLAFVALITTLCFILKPPPPFLWNVPTSQQCVSQPIRPPAHLDEVLHQGPTVHFAFVEAGRHHKGGVGSSSRHLLSQPHGGSSGWSHKHRQSWPLTFEKVQQQIWFPPQPPSSSPLATCFHPTTFEATHTNTLCAFPLPPRKTLDTAAHKWLPHTRRKWE